MRAAIYVRVSTEEQSDQGVSLDAQEVACRNEAQRLGATSMTLYRDEGFSGTNLKRPAVRQLMEDMPGLDAVIVWRLDRLCRAPGDWETLLAAFEANDCGFVSVSERVDAATPWGRAILRVMAVFAGLFVDTLRENIRMAMQHIAESGRKPGSPCLGYVFDEESRLVPDPEQAEIVRELFRRVSKGEALMSIARDFNARRIPQVRGGKLWEPTTLRWVLRNPVYVGEFNWRGQTLPGAHEPIITRREWKRVQSVLTTRGPSNGHKPKHFSSLFRCGLCQGRMSATRAYSTYETLSGQTRRQYNIMKCARRMVDREVHGPVSTGEDRAMAVVWRHTELLLEGYELREAVESARAREEAGSGRRRAIQGRLQEIEKALVRGTELYQAGGTTIEALLRANAPLLSEQEELRRELGTLSAGPELATWERLLSSKSAGWRSVRDRGAPEEQLAYLRVLYKRVLVYPRRLVFEYVGDIRPPDERPVPKYWRPHLGVGF